MPQSSHAFPLWELIIHSKILFVLKVRFYFRKLVNKYKIDLYTQIMYKQNFIGCQIPVTIFKISRERFKTSSEFIDSYIMALTSVSREKY